MWQDTYAVLTAMDIDMNGYVDYEEFKEAAELFVETASGTQPVRKQKQGMSQALGWLSNIFKK